MKYASLVGPLIGIYYPLPFDTELKNRLALSSSRLKLLWCSLYDEQQVDEAIREFGGIKLPASFARALDYDSFVVNQGDSK